MTDDPDRTDDDDGVVSDDFPGDRPGDLPGDADGVRDGDPVADAENVERADEPYAELEDAGSARDVGRSDGGTAGEDPFSEMDVGPMPEEDPGPDAEDSSGSDLGSIIPEVQEAPPDLDVPTGEKEAIVAKRRYCESCEHFSDPPEVACTHPGTEIREVVDVEHFRVYDCPVVARRRGLDWDDGDADDAIDATDGED